MSHLVKTVKLVLGCGFLDKKEVDYIMGEIKKAIQKLEEISKE